LGLADCRGYGFQQALRGGVGVAGQYCDRQGDSRQNAPNRQPPQGAHVEWPRISVGDDTVYLLRHQRASTRESAH
jgi:hypothetical protein